MSLTEELLEQFDWHWQVALQPRLRTLSDEQYLWEPVPGCWSLRHRHETDVAQVWGAGDHVMEQVEPPPDPPPVTTIAWRLGHLAIDVFGARASNHFGDGSVRASTTDWPPTAAGGVALFEEHYGRWRSHVADLDDDALARPCGPAEGHFADEPFRGLVLHLNREALHHGAEIMLLLDLHRATGGRPLPAPRG
jgi:hypothetical protein